jgi:hypothetical protein
MRQTIGRHWPKTLPPDDFVAVCDYCMVPYPRSRLTRDASGFLACDADYGGDVVTITEENAANAGAPVLSEQTDGGRYPKTDTSAVVQLDTIIRRTF